MPPQKKLAYALLFGFDWRYSMLGYAYLRCVDNVVDDVEDEATSLELMAEQRNFMATAYESTVKPEDIINGKIAAELTPMEPIYRLLKKY